MRFSLNTVKAGLGEVQTLHKWAVTIPNPAAVAGEFPESLQVRVQTAGIPLPEVINTEIELGGHSFNNNGKIVKKGTLVWSFIEGTDAKVIEYFTNWIAARWSGDGVDTKGQSATTADCKGDLLMELLGPDDETTQSYDMVGSLPSFAGIGEGGQAPDPLNPQIQFDYDDFHIHAGSANW